MACMWYVWYVVWQQTHTNIKLRLIPSFLLFCSHTFKCPSESHHLYGSSSSDCLQSVGATRGPSAWAMNTPWTPHSVHLTHPHKTLLSPCISAGASGCLLGLCHACPTTSPTQPGFLPLHALSPLFPGSHSSFQTTHWAAIFSSSSNSPDPTSTPIK